MPSAKRALATLEEGTEGGGGRRVLSRSRRGRSVLCSHASATRGRGSLGWIMCSSARKMMKHPQVIRKFEKFVTSSAMAA